MPIEISYDAVDFNNKSSPEAPAIRYRRNSVGHNIMVIEYIRYRIAQEQQAQFLSAYAQASKALSSSEYCLGYELAHCEEEPDRFILRIQWTSTEDHMGKFRSSAQFQEFLPHIRPYIGNIEEMQHYHITDVRSDDKIRSQAVSP